MLENIDQKGKILQFCFFYFNNVTQTNIDQIQVTTTLL